MQPNYALRALFLQLTKRFNCVILYYCGDIILDKGGILLDLFFYFSVIKDIIVTFFQNGIWVLGFFYLLIKIFENAKLKYFSKYVIAIVLVILFINAIWINIYNFKYINQ